MFVSCCAQSVARTLTVTFGGSLSALGSIAIINDPFNTGDTNLWASSSDLPETDCTGAPPNIAAALTCQGLGWALSASGTKGSDNWSFLVTEQSTSNCNPFFITANGPVTGTICTGTGSMTITE